MPLGQRVGGELKNAVGLSQQAREPSKSPASGSVGLMPQAAFVATKQRTEMVFHGKCKALTIHAGTSCSCWVVKPKEGFKGSWKR